MAFTKASGAWTLTLGGNVKSLAGWGLESVVLNIGSLITGTLTARRPLARIEQDALCAYGATAVLRDPTGNIRFAGKRAHVPGNASGRDEHQLYRFVDAWRDLERRKYEQLWTVTVTAGGVSTKNQVYNPHLILNAGRTVAEEIENIITYAASQGVNLAVGSIYEEDVYPATDEVICRDCASLIGQLMAWLPGYIAWIDYSAATPTFNCAPESQLTAVTVPAFGASGSEDLTIEPLHEDVASAVAIRYERLDRVTVDGETRERPVITHDVYPPTATGREEGAVSELVTLAGSTRNTITAPLTVGDFPGANADADFETATALANFWKEKIFNLQLDDPGIDQTSLRIIAGSFTRAAARSADEDDPTELVTLPRYLIAGQIADWMRDDNDDQILWQKQKLTIKVAYDQYEDAAAATAKTASKKVDTFVERTLSIYVTATSAPSGHNVYSLDTEIEDAEQPLAGLAEFLYNRLSTLRYQGQRRHILNECDAVLTMGKKLNLSGGAAEWASMNAAINGLTLRIDSGDTTVNFGPTPRESVGLRVALAKAHRTRRRWTATAQQTTGEL